MSVIGRIRSALPSGSKLITKGLGLAALGMVAYDSHYVGKLQSDLYASEKDAASTAYYFNNSRYVTDMRKSTEAIKNASYTMELDQTYKRFFNEGIGYIKGFASMLVNNVIPLGLGLGALFGGKVASKGSAIGLAVYGAYKFIKNFFGLGTPPGLKFDQ